MAEFAGPQADRLKRLTRPEPEQVDGVSRSLRPPELKRNKNVNSLLTKIIRRVTLSHLIPGVVRETSKLEAKLDDVLHRLARLQEAVGRLESRQTAGAPGIRDAEFQVFSQWGEDGIIQHLIRHVPIGRKAFVEFGVEGYDEANTRFLLLKDDWAGLVMDGDPGQIAKIRTSRAYWLHDLKAETAFVTRQNINDLLRRHGMAGEIGLLSIDIDGVDWHIWEAIDAASPGIVVVEYNHLFGPTRAVTVPYRPDFDRTKAHHSICYYGSSLAAWQKLADRKGYDLVGCGSAGLNAFFVRRDLRPEVLPALSSQEAFVPGSFCEYHDEAGRRVKKSREEMMELVQSMPLQEV